MQHNNAGASLPPPSSASMAHARHLHEHGAPNDAISLGRSLEKLLHRHNVTAFDCVIRLLVTANNHTAPHVAVDTHPVSGKPHTYMRFPLLLEALNAAVAEAHTHDSEIHKVDINKRPEKAMHPRDTRGGSTRDRDRSVKEMRCDIPRHAGWSAYHEEKADDEKFAGDVAGLGIEPAGAPAFEHNMALYEMDTLMMAGSGMPAQRLAEFFHNMGAEVTSLQLDARAHFEDAMGGALVWEAAARGGRFVSASALCCWDVYADGVEHTRTVLKNASLCWQGDAEACMYSYAPLIPSIDALTQGYSLQELLVLHTAWADWFHARLPPAQWINIRLAPRQDTNKLTIVYASSHTFMNHGSHYTLRAVFEAHDDKRLHVIQLLMVSEQVRNLSNLFPFFMIFVQACVCVLCMYVGT
jgi:hypothetical protein